MKNRRLLAVLLVFLLALIGLVVCVVSVQKSTPSANTTYVSPTEQKDTDITTQPTNIPQEIIKCQNVVVSPLDTVELFTYKSDNKARFDYRVSSSKEENALKLQLFSDGDWLYLWEEPIYYDKADKPKQIKGFKARESSLLPSIQVTELNKVVYLSAGGGSVSGDKMCKVWEDGEYVFELPTEVVFEESKDLKNTIAQYLERLCAVCNGATGEDTQNACESNLSCK